MGASAAPASDSWPNSPSSQLAGPGTCCGHGYHGNTEPGTDSLPCGAIRRHADAEPVLRTSHSTWCRSQRVSYWATRRDGRAGRGTAIVDRAGNEIDLGYDDLNRLTAPEATLASGFGGDTLDGFAYDALGRRTQAEDDDSIVQFTYDSLGRVLTETQGSKPGLGRRTYKVFSSDTTRFVYADQQCLEEYDGSDNSLRLFAFGTGLDELVMMEAEDVTNVDGDTNTTEIKRFYHTQLIGPSEARKARGFSQLCRDVSLPSVTAPRDTRHRGRAETIVAYREGMARGQSTP